MNRRNVLGAFAALGCSPVFANVASAAGQPLRLGTAPTDASAEYFYAAAQGFFEKAGFAAEVSTLANGEGVTAGVIGGSLDIGNGQAISMITAHSKGIPITLVCGGAVNTQSSPGAAGAFFVPPTSTALTGKDFVGKTIGVQGLRGFAQYGTMAWLDRTGGDSASVKFVELTSSVMATALLQNRIDGAFIPEPNVSNVAKVAKKIALPMDGIAPSFISGVHFARREWAVANAPLVRRFEALMYETGAWANKNHDKTAEMLATAIHLDIEAVRNSVRIDYVTRKNASLLQPMINLTVKYAGIPPFSAEDLFFKA